MNTENSIKKKRTIIIHAIEKEHHQNISQINLRSGEKITLKR